MVKNESIVVFQCFPVHYFIAPPSLTISTFIDHSWVKNILPLSIVPRRRGQQIFKLDLDQGCLSTSFMSRSQDISFGIGSPVGCEVQSPTFTCKSSFVSRQLSPSSRAGGFSFHDSSGSNTLEYSTPVIALPSFAFFSSGSAAEHQQTDASVLSPTANLIPRGNIVSLVERLVFFEAASLL